MLVMLGTSYTDVLSSRGEGRPLPKKNVALWSMPLGHALPVKLGPAPAAPPLAHKPSPAPTLRGRGPRAHALRLVPVPES